jgi:hypothetical protein
MEFRFNVARLLLLLAIWAVALVLLEHVGRGWRGAVLGGAMGATSAGLVAKRENRRQKK